MKRKRIFAYLLCQILGWGAYVTTGLIFYVGTDRNIARRWPRYAALFACAGLVAIWTTHIYRHYISRRGWLHLPLSRVAPRILAFSFVLMTALTAQISVLWWLFGTGTFRDWNWVLPALFSWLWPSFLWQILYFGVHYFEQYRRAEMEKLQLAVIVKEAQLQRLMAQINPHFMFNCLNSVRALITEDPPQAKNMVTGLSELLRYSLQSGHSATVPLHAELEIVRTYLRLEVMRFEERLTSSMEIAPETLSLPVPAMILQSLVENGVKHGIEKLPDGGEIRVTSGIENNFLRVRVISSGQLSTGNGSARNGSTGIGLANARERLRLLYGPAATLIVENHGGDRVQAEMSLPLPGGRM